MRYFRPRSRRFTAFALLTALLFAHSALAVAACLQHLHASHQVGSEDVASHDGHPGPAQSHDATGVLCQFGCETQAQARDYVKALEIPTPVGHKIYFVLPPLLALPWLELWVERPDHYLAAAPPPLPLTILLSRFRN